MTYSLLPTRLLSPQGFTTIELMITLTVVAILVVVAAPSINEAIMSVRITGQTNDLMSDLALARSEAARRNVPVVVCSSSNGTTCSNSAWKEGWVVYPDTTIDGVQAATADEKAIKMRRKLEGATNELVLNCAGTTANADKRVTYAPTGTATRGLVFTLCDSRTTDKAGRTITINATGRPVSARVTCPFTVPAANCP
jgi:type IV fimbrial biogenesis protein FimT